MIFKPHKTGLYNISLSYRNYETTDDLFFKINEIGILEVPEHIFQDSSTLDRYEAGILENWDSVYIVFGIVHLERFKDYKIQGGLEIYKGYLLQYSLGSSKKLDGNNPNEELYTEGDTLNVTAEGDYLFYELIGNPFLIHYQDAPSQTPNIIGGYSLLLLGIISLVPMLIISKKRFK